MSATQTSRGWVIACTHDGCTWEAFHRFLNAATAALHRHTTDHHTRKGARRP